MISRDAANGLPLFTGYGSQGSAQPASNQSQSSSISSHIFTRFLNDFRDMCRVVSDEAVAKFLTDTQRESFEDLKVDEDDEAEVFAQVCP